MQQRITTYINQLHANAFMISEIFLKLPNGTDLIGTDLDDVNNKL